MKRKKILHIVGFLGRGGDTTAIMNVLSYITKNDINIDFEFLTHEGYDVEFVNNIRNQGVKVHILKGDVRKLGPIKYFTETLSFFKKNAYDAVHYHTSFQSCIGLIAAKIAGIRGRVCHSHTSTVQRNFNKHLLKLFLPICKFIIGKFATQKVACSKEAGSNLFFNESFDIVYNGLDLEELKHIDEIKVKQIKKSLNISDNDIVIGQVGRFSPMKNQMFTVNLAERLQNDNYKFVFLGKGESFETIKKVVYSKKIENVYFLGHVSDVKNYMAIFDYLLLPSLYGEGLPVALIEQQIVKESSICITNENTSKESNIGNVIFKDLIVDEWIEEIKNKKIYNKVDQRSFDINNTSKEWLKLYDVHGV